MGGRCPVSFFHLAGLGKGIDLIDKNDASAFQLSDLAGLAE